MALSRANIQARLSKHFPGEQERILTDLLMAVQADAVTVNTALTTLATKLNNDATVTDTNYVGATIPVTGL
jgi:hypothetical protein